MYLYQSHHPKQTGVLLDWLKQANWPKVASLGNP